MLEIAEQNKLTEERDTKIENTQVVKIAASKQGDWIGCIEERSDDGNYQEIRLKFYHFDDVNQIYALNTSIEFPHENGVNAIEFQQSHHHSGDLLCATSGNDNQFKIWCLIDSYNIYHKNKVWRCDNIGYYKNLPSNALSFSSDGSLLAVAFGSCLTTWRPDTCDFKCSLVHPHFQSTLRFVQFGNVDQSHLIVTASSNRICVWNLLTLGLTWTVPIQVSLLCADPLSIYMAVITRENSLFVFAPGSSTPVYFKQKLTNDNENIIAILFMPKSFEQSTRLVWQKMSEFYFMTTNQELLCLEAADEIAQNIPLEYSAKSQRSAFESLLAETAVSNRKNSEIIHHKEIGLIGATEIKHLIEPPIHTMAPMRLFCNSVLRSFIIKDEPSIISKTNNKDEDNDSDSDIDKEDDDSDVDVPAKTTLKIPNRRNIDSSSNKKSNLNAVLSEPLKWTSVLLD